MAVTKKDFDKFVEQGKKMGQKALVEGKKLYAKASVEGKKLYNKAAKEIDKNVTKAKIAVIEQKIGHIINTKKITVNNAEVKAELQKIAKLTKGKK